MALNALQQDDGERPPTESPVLDGTPILRLTDVGKSFHDPNGQDVTALESVTLDIIGNQFVSLVGPSGCGKTTLLRMLKGLEHPTTGTIEQVSGNRELNVAMVFQDASLLPWQRLDANVGLGLHLRAGRHREDLSEDSKASRIRSLLEMLGLSGFESAYPRQLSGGMRQRANLARALAVRPDLMLMDEPFSALDTFTRERLQRELSRLSAVAETRTTTVFVTHDVREAVFLSDLVVVMGARPGRVIGTYEVDVPRPRTESFQQSVDLAERARHVRAMLGGI